MSNLAFKYRHSDYICFGDFVSNDTTKHLKLFSDCFHLINGECLDQMCYIADNSVDMILCDLPYGTTKEPWDKRISLDQLWKHYKRVVKPNGIVALFAPGSGTYSSKIIMSNEDDYWYQTVWEKNKSPDFLQASKRPMCNHEFINVFRLGLQCDTTYNPQETFSTPYKAHSSTANVGKIYGNMRGKNRDNPTGARYPKTVQKFDVIHGGHPTEKPVDLLEYLIKTHSNENDIILDHCMGSGSTGEACFRTRRQFIGIERNSTFYKKSVNRIKSLG